MCTGDNLDTAIAISKNAGIITQTEIDDNGEYAATTGKEFRSKVGETLIEIEGEDGKKEISV